MPSDAHSSSFKASFLEGAVYVKVIADRGADKN